MKYIGNFSQYIPEGIYDILMLPHHQKDPLTEETNPHEWGFWKKAGYTQDKISYYELNNDVFKLDIPLPSEIFGEVVEIWFTRMDPGDSLPLHQDNYDFSGDNLVRYSMFLQDYKPGHVFVHSDHIIFGYKSGDVYEFDGAFAWHAACNIGLESRFTMQIVSRKS
jgi:hypothetical protein